MLHVAVIAIGTALGTLSMLMLRHTLNDNEDRGTFLASVSGALAALSIAVLAFGAIGFGGAW